MTNIRIEIDHSNNEIPNPIPLWMVKEDREIFGRIRYCAPCPAVITLKDDPHAIFNKQWQFFYRAINYNIPLNYISQNYGDSLAFFNGSGFPERRDWVNGGIEDEGKDDPNADKVRTCVRNVVTGVKVGTYLKIETFDSQLLPPLKLGRSYPETVEQINVNDYAIVPRTHRWMFVVENIVNRAGLVKPFDNGANYDWTGTNDYFTFLPLISNHKYGDVLYPLVNLVELPLGSPIPSPYRFS